VARVSRHVVRRPCHGLPACLPTAAAVAASTDRRTDAGDEPLTKPISVAVAAAATDGDGDARRTDGRSEPVTKTSRPLSYVTQRRRRRTLTSIGHTDSIHHQQQQQQQQRAVDIATSSVREAITHIT